MVQDPQDAEYPELPSRALETLAPDVIVRLDAMGPEIIRLIGEPVPPTTAPPLVVLEARSIGRARPRTPS